MDKHTEEQFRALEGCARLYKFAAGHLTSNPPNYVEAAKAVRVALETGDQVQQALIMKYITSEQFESDMFKGLQDTLDDYKDEYGYKGL